MPLWPINISQRGKNIQWGKNNLFIKWCWKNWTGMSKKMKLDHHPIPYTRINSKWTKLLRLKAIKILEENTSSKISNISLSNVFSDISPQARETKEK